MTLPQFPPRFDTDLLRPYWDALSRGELHLPACSVCGAWQWYPYEFVKCHSSAQHEWKPVSTTGTVFTFTVVHRSLLPNSQRDAEPFVSALVEPDGLQGVRIPGLLINPGARAPHIGQQVQLRSVPCDGYALPAFEPC